MRVSDTSVPVQQRSGRMARPARRAQLLEAALQIFVSQGYHAAAMDDIADRAGVSKPVLYQHFPGKLDLYLALLDSSCEAVVAAVRSALAVTEDNKERVAATVDAFYTYVANDKAAFRLVFESDLTQEPAVRERVDKVTTESATMVAAPNSTSRKQLTVPARPKTHLSPMRSVPSCARNEVSSPMCTQRPSTSRP